MSVKTIVGKFGGQSALASELGIQQSAVAYWVKKGAIPSKWHGKLLTLAKNNGVSLSASELIFQDEMPPIEHAEDLQPIVDKREISLNSANQLAPSHLEAVATPFMFYASSDGAIKVQVMIGDETVWASQKGMAEIFDVESNTINYHLREIFSSGELDEHSVARKFRVTASDGKNYDTNFYNLDAIISVGYRVNSVRATQFRRWATSVLKEYLIKGYVLNDDRLKQGNNLFGKDYFDELLEKIREIRASERRFYQKITDIYAQCSVDYDKHSPIAQQFYAHVQDKLHYAIHGHTSAELIKLRADASKPNMGLSSYKNEPKGGKITKLDVTVGKNYLTEEELENMNRLVSMYLDFAENFAKRRKLLTMKDWAEKLDDFLEFNAYEVLDNFGGTRRDTAERHAIQEYEKFRIVQDREYKSDFDEVVDRIKTNAQLPKQSH